MLGLQTKHAGASSLDTTLVNLGQCLMFYISKVSEIILILSLIYLLTFFVAFLKGFFFFLNKKLPSWYLKLHFLFFKVNVIYLLPQHLVVAIVQWLCELHCEALPQNARADTLRCQLGISHDNLFSL